MKFKHAILVAVAIVGVAHLAYADRFRNKRGQMPMSPPIDSTSPIDGNVTVTQPSNAANRIVFTAASDDVGVDHYRVVFLTGGTNPAVNCTNGTELLNGALATVNHTSLTIGTTYRYRVCAYDALLNVSTGATGLGIPTDQTNPTDGAAVTVTPGTLQHGLSWNAGADNVAVDHYVIRRATSSTPPANCAAGSQACADTGSTSCTATSLTDCTAYAFRVCAVDAAGNSSTGITATGTTLCAGTAIATGTSPSLSTYAWPTAGSANLSPMLAFQGGTNANMPLSATNTTYTQHVSTAPTGDNAPFGNKAGLLALGIGSSRLNDAWSAAAGACWINTSPTGYSAINEGTNWHERVIFRPTTGSSAKNILVLNTSASEYIRLQLNSAVLTMTVREGSSGNQTFGWTTPISYWHIVDFFYVSDCNGDSGNPCMYMYADGGLAESISGNFTPSGTELGVNMAQFGALTSLGLGCDAVEANRWNGEILDIEFDVGATTTNRYGAAPANWLSKHRQDCLDSGICASDTTIMVAGYGQSLIIGFNQIATSAVSVTSNVATATVLTAHGILAGDKITTTGMTTNAADVIVTSVDATHVVYPLTASNGALADGVGTIALVARTQTQAYNDRECLTGSIIPLAVEGRTWANADGYESPMTALTNQLHVLRTGEQYVQVERGVSSTALYSLNKASGDGDNATTNFTNMTTAIDNCDDRLAKLGTDPVRAVMVFGQGNVDLQEPEFSEWFSTFQDDVDADTKAITLQSQEVPICLNQMMSFTAAPLPSTVLTQEVLDIHKNMCSTGRACLTGTSYAFPYNQDGAHYTAAGFQALGRQYAKCVNAMLNGVEPPVTYPTSITCSGTAVTIHINTPTPPLVVDTSYVSEPIYTPYGFLYADTDPAATPSISSANCSAACSGSDCTCVLTMSASPCGLMGARIEYAYTGTNGNNGGPTTGPRGNIRDSSATDLDANWLVGFDQHITRSFTESTHVDLDGVNEYCSAADNAEWSCDDEDKITIEWTGRVDTSVTDNHIFSKGTTVAGYEYALISHDTTGDYALRFQLTAGNYCEFGTFLYSTDYEVVCTYDGAGSTNDDKVDCFAGAVGSALTLQTCAFTGTIPATLGNNAVAVNLGQSGDSLLYMDGYTRQLAMWCWGKVAIADAEACLRTSNNPRDLMQATADVTTTRNCNWPQGRVYLEVDGDTHPTLVNHAWRSTGGNFTCTNTEVGDFAAN